MNQTNPADLRPFLIGLLVDVSASMGDQLANGSGTVISRIESLENSLDEVFKYVRSFCDDVESPQSPFDIFALGFGFGNLRDNLLTLFGKKGPPTVRSLLTDSVEDSIVDGQSFLERWKEHRAAIHELAKSMGGATPLVEAVATAESIFSRAFLTSRYHRPGVLLIVSDGMPTDPPVTGAQLVRSTVSVRRTAVQPIRRPGA